MDHLPERPQCFLEAEESTTQGRLLFPISHNGRSRQIQAPQSRAPVRMIERCKSNRGYSSLNGCLKVVRALRPIADTLHCSMHSNRKSGLNGRRSG